MVAKLAMGLAVIYVPTMWVLAVFCCFMGILGVVAPSQMRTMISIFTRRKWAWVNGVMLLLLGAEIFVRAPGTSLPLLVRTMGTFVFVSGGVMIFIPTLCIIIAEWFVSWSDNWLRLVGLVNLALTYIFYLGTRVQIVHNEVTQLFGFPPHL